MGVGGLIHGEHFIVDSYMLNGTHTQADKVIANSGNITSPQLSQRLPLLNRTDRISQSEYLHNQITMVQTGRDGMFLLMSSYGVASIMLIDVYYRILEWTLA